MDLGNVVETAVGVSFLQWAKDHPTAFLIGIVVVLFALTVGAFLLYRRLKRESLHYWSRGKTVISSTERRFDDTTLRLKSRFSRRNPREISREDSLPREPEMQDPKKRAG